jgi:hypothetical protein
MLHWQRHCCARGPGRLSSEALARCIRLSQVKCTCTTGAFDLCKSCVHVPRQLALAGPWSFEQWGCSRRVHATGAFKLCACAAST